MFEILREARRTKNEIWHGIHKKEFLDMWSVFVLVASRTTKERFCLSVLFAWSISHTQLSDNQYLHCIAGGREHRTNHGNLLAFSYGIQLTHRLINGRRGFKPCMVIAWTCNAIRVENGDYNYPHVYYSNVVNYKHPSCAIQWFIR